MMIDWLIVFHSNIYRKWKKYHYHYFLFWVINVFSRPEEEYILNTDLALGSFNHRANRINLKYKATVSCTFLVWLLR